MDLKVTKELLQLILQFICPYCDYCHYEAQEMQNHLMKCSKKERRKTASKIQAILSGDPQNNSGEQQNDEIQIKGEPEVFEFEPNIEIENKATKVKKRKSSKNQANPKVPKKKPRKDPEFMEIVPKIEHFFEDGSHAPEIIPPKNTAVATEDYESIACDTRENFDYCEAEAARVMGLAKETEDSEASRVMGLAEQIANAAETVEPLDLNKKSQRKNFACKECDKVFLYKNHLQEHNNQFHHNAKVECDNCLRLFKPKANSKDTICNRCARELQKENINELQNEILEEERKNRIKPEKFKLKLKPDKSLSKPNNDKERKFVCPECSDTFLRKNHLWEHVNKKHWNFHFKCKGCKFNYRPCKSDYEFSLQRYNNVRAEHEHCEGNGPEFHENHENVQIEKSDQTGEIVQIDENTQNKDIFQGQKSHIISQFLENCKNPEPNQKHETSRNQGNTKNLENSQDPKVNKNQEISPKQKNTIIHADSIKQENTDDIVEILP